MGELFSPLYCSSFAALFRSPLLQRIQKGEHRGHLDPLLKDSRFRGFDKITSWKLGDVLDSIFSVIRRHYRCEYVYKSALADLVLSDIYTVSAFAEFWASNSKADFVVANGTTVAYEIKTQLDSLVRLKSQIHSYMCVFDEVYVVTHSGLLPDVMELMDSRIGILEFTDTAGLQKIRPAKSNKDKVNPKVIFDSLRRLEYLKILQLEFGTVPDMPNTQIYRYCRELFSHLSPRVAHYYFANALKERGKEPAFKQLVAQAPESLRALYLTSNLRIKNLQAVQERVEDYY